ncbi:DMT family transporter [uncultured Agrobacterium sp.]|uniref:DMT family transporter n=1 Tax=uncultured Agrobacterium sp. TaxID=157277 RepID=UPI002587D2C6|nr:DMT family transporter [uncultured Agrobacterium sp.]
MIDKGTFEMIAAMAICGTIGITVLASGQTELDLIFYRCLFGAIFLAGIVIPRKYIQSYLSAKTAIWAALGGLALLANWYFLFSAYRNTSVGVATTVYNTQPLMMILFGVVLFGEKITSNTLGWMAISISGLALISKIFVDGEIAASSSYLWGICEALLAALLYAVAAIIARKLKSTPPALIALIQFLIGAIMLAPFANLSILTRPEMDIPTLATLMLGIVHTGLMYVLLYGAIQKIEAWRVASISFLYPAIALVLDAIILGVQLDHTQWAGVALILIGAAGINLKWRLPVLGLHW